MDTSPHEHDAARIPDLGAWVIKCNPQYTDPSELLEHDGLDDYWSMTNSASYRLDEMKAGDRVVFYVGRGSSKVRGGFWGAGWVTEGNVRDSITDTGSWADKDRAASRTTWLGIEISFWDEPVTIEQARADEVLAGCEPIAKPQVSPAYLTAAELAELLTAAGREDAFDEAAELKAKYSTTEIKKLVEQSAIKRAIKHYKKGGYVLTADLQQKRGPGYDLEFTRSKSRGNEVIRVEVKGLIGPDPTVRLTPNELKAAQKTPGWRLFVVTEALDKKPRVSEHDGRSAYKMAVKETYSVSLGDKHAG